MIKQLLIFEVNKDTDFRLPMNIGSLIENNSKFLGCKSSESESDGFIPVEPGSLYSYEINDTALKVSILRFQRQKKVIPAGELKKRVKVRIKELESKNVKMTRDSKSDVEFYMRKEMAKSAFSNFNQYYVFLFHELQVVAVNGSESLAEDIIALVRKSLPNNVFPLVPYSNKSLQGLFKDCIDEKDEDFVIGSYAAMFSEADKSEVVFKNKSNLEELADKAQSHRIRQLSLEGLDMQLDISDLSPINLSKIKFSMELEKTKPSMDQKQKQQIFDSNVRLELSSVQSVLKKLIQLT